MGVVVSTIQIAILAFIVSLPLSLIALYLDYVSVMSFKRVKEKDLLTPIAKTLGGAVLIRGYMLDAYVNVFLMTLILLELPQELTVTSRLKRHNLLPGTWGYRVAQWAAPELDPYDPTGKHL
jgi:hypothetical protein